jgi:hypothetical protein
VLDLKNNEPKVKERGSICIRRGITKSCPGGTGWEFVIGVRSRLVNNKYNVKNAAISQKCFFIILLEFYRVVGVLSAIGDTIFHIN